MANEPKRIIFTLETLLDSVDLAEDITLKMAEAVGFDEEESHKIGMSVREGVINAVHYGNQGQREKKITLTFELEEDRLVVKVLDQGPGFEMHEVPDPLSEENLLKTSGRGLFLMQSFMDEFAVHKVPQGGAEVRMVKRFPSVNGTGRTAE